MDHPEYIMNNTQIKKLRLSIPATRNEFANHLDVDASTIWRWETGRSKPRPAHIRMLKKLAQSLEN